MRGRSAALSFQSHYVEDFILKKIAGQLGERGVVISPRLRVALCQNVEESLARKKNKKI